MNRRRPTILAGLTLLAGVCLACSAGLVALVTGCGKPQTPAAPARPAFVAMAQSAGTSMLPLFAERETVALELCRFSDLAPGNTVIFWHDGTQQYVHHELWFRNERDGRWHTRGINNPRLDTGRMTSDEFVGRTRKLTR